MGLTHRHSAGFGKRIEYYIVGLLLKAGLDVYLPLVDDDAIDAVVKTPDGRFAQVQIKARSKDVIFGNAAFFAGLKHKYRRGYWFVFYSERIDTIWVLSSQEFLKEAAPVAKDAFGKNAGTHSILFNGKNTKAKTEHVKPQYQKYIASNFDRILYGDPDAKI